MWACLGCLGLFWSVQGCFWGVGGCICALRGIWKWFLLNSYQFKWCTNKSTDILQKTWRFQISKISKCPKVTVILSYWEASGEVSKPRYKSLLYFSSNGLYCITITWLVQLLLRFLGVHFASLLLLGFWCHCWSIWQNRNLDGDHNVSW